MTHSQCDRAHPHVCCFATRPQMTFLGICNTLQHTQHNTEPHRNPLQPTATQCSTLQRNATHRNTMQHTAAQCNTLQHAAAHYSTLQHTATRCNMLQHAATHCSTLQHAAGHCNTLQHTAAYSSTIEHTAEPCKVLQHTATHCNALPLDLAVGLRAVGRSMPSTRGLTCDVTNLCVCHHILTKFDLIYVVFVCMIYPTHVQHISFVYVTFV